MWLGFTIRIVNLSHVDAHSVFVSIAVNVGMTQCSASGCVVGSKSVMTTAKLQTGLLPTPRNAPSAEQLLKKMVVAITWCANVVALTSVGYVWVHGNHMDHHGTIATAMMKMKQRKPEMLRRNLAQCFNVICSTVTAI